MARTPWRMKLEKRGIGGAYCASFCCAGEKGGMKLKHDKRSVDIMQIPTDRRRLPAVWQG